MTVGSLLSVIPNHHSIDEVILVVQIIILLLHGGGTIQGQYLQEIEDTGSGLTQGHHMGRGAEAKAHVGAGAPV